jgi:hypothetical protein
LENEPVLVWAPLQKVAEAAKEAGCLPDESAAFIEQNAKGRRLPSASQPQHKVARASGGGGRRTVGYIEPLSGPSPAYGVQWGAGGDEASLADLLEEGQGFSRSEKSISKKQFDAFQKATSSQIAALQSALKTAQEKLDVLAGKDHDDDSAEQWQLQEYDQQMRTIMGQLGSVVAILSGSMQPTDPMLKAAHCVMDSIVSNMDNVYKWDDERKRVILESMKHQEPFKVALSALKPKKN